MRCHYVRIIPSYPPYSKSPLTCHVSISARCSTSGIARLADNGGIYAILAQFLVISVVAGVLCFAAPSSALPLSSRSLPSRLILPFRAVVSVTTPSFLSYILGVLCFAVAAGQPFGFFGVYREKPRLFKALFVRSPRFFRTLR